MLIVWLVAGVLSCGMIGEEESRHKAFFTSGVTFSEGPTLKAGEVAAIIQYPEGGDTVMVKTDDGIVFDAGSDLISVIPPMQVGDRVEMYPHSPDIPKDQLRFQQQTGVISSIYDNKAEVQFFARPNPVSIPLNQLVPECYGRGQRDYETPGSVCSCSPSWSGNYCLTPAAKSEVSMFAKIRNFLIGSPVDTKESSIDANQSPPENVTEVLWNGYLYTGVIEVNTVNLKFVLRSASFTVVLACAIWEPLCGVALDTLSESNLTGAPEPEENRKQRRTRNECTADDAIQLEGPVRVRKAWMDTSSIDTATRGPWTTVFKGKDFYTTYDGPLNSPLALSSFMSKIMTDTITITSSVQLRQSLERSNVVTFLSTDFAEIFKGDKPPLFFETISKPEMLLTKEVFAEVGIEMLHTSHDEEQCSYDAVVITKGTHNNVCVRYCYPRGERATKNDIYRWVSRTAVPLVTELSPSNFESESKFATEYSTTMLILPPTSTITLSEFERHATQEKTLALPTSTRCYTLGPTRSEEFSKRFGHSNLIVLLPYVELCGYLDSFPASAEEALRSMKTNPPLTAFSDRVAPAGRQLNDIITLTPKEIANLPFSDCTLREHLSITRMLLFIRTSWCWYCRTLFPVIEELGRIQSQFPTITIAQHVVDEGIPTWLDRHTEGYPEILLIDFSSSCSNPTVSRYQQVAEVSDRSLRSLLQFATGHTQPDFISNSSEPKRITQLRQKGRDAARRRRKGDG